MFDFRYHALSLVAVIVALVLGLLLGVAIGDSGLVSSAERRIRDDLRTEVSKANHRADGLDRELDQKERFEREVYPLLVGGQLEGKRVGLVFLGTPSDEIAGHVRAALQESGGRLASVVALREPPDLAGLSRRAAGTRYADLAGTPDLVRGFGERMGRQYAQGGRLVGREAHALFATQAGRLGPLDAVVVYRETPELDGDASHHRDDIEDGFVAGLHGAGLQTAGVEVKATDPSRIGWYRDRDLSTVDDVDDTSGRAALVFLLAGAEGDYGVKPTAEALLPQVAGGAPSP